MFQKTELERLRRQKDLLVLQSDAYRQLLTAQWQRVRSPENWLNEGAALARRHPLWVTGLAAVGGVLAVKALRKPSVVAGGIGGLLKLATTAFSMWKLFPAMRLPRRDSRES